MRGGVKSLGADCIEKPMKGRAQGGAAQACSTRAGVNGAIDLGEFRRYGSARKLYHFHVDNVGVVLMDRAGPLDPHPAAQVGDVRRLLDRRNPPRRGDRHL